MEKPFNSTFFATVAVIVPVVFLALAVQSDYLARMFLPSRRMDRLSSHPPMPTQIRNMSIWYFGLIPAVLGFLVIAYAVLGEFLSLLALDQRQAMIRSQTYVMQSVDLLLLAAVAVSVWRIIEAIITANKEAKTKADALDQSAR
jgi:hypothetical protein